MLSILLCDHKHEEIKILKKAFQDCIAYMGDESSEIETMESSEALAGWLKCSVLLDYACVDVVPKNGIKDTYEIRKTFPNSSVVIIADDTVSPLSYMRPGIMASALLLRPLLPDTVFKTIEELLSDSLNDEYDEQLSLDTKEGLIRIPFREICFIEARAKKVYVRLKTKEYGYYDTLEHLLEFLPDNFMRCHRGIIVNIKKIREIHYSENLIFLEDGMQIPVSRSYKSVLKGIAR